MRRMEPHYEASLSPSYFIAHLNLIIAGNGILPSFQQLIFYDL